MDDIVVRVPSPILATDDFGPMVEDLIVGSMGEDERAYEITRVLVETLKV